jgi:hypothetical protein
MSTQPKIINNLFNNKEYLMLKNSFLNYKTFEFQQGFSRYVAADNSLKILSEYAEKVVPVARDAFSSNSLLPTYTLFAHYEGSNPPPSLYKHKDDNACTYTVDMCLYQKEPWDLFVDGVSYTLNENQALAYYGNDQLHWREGFPNPGKNHVAMIFFHFAEPDHWWFTKGPGYLGVVRGEITEKEFQYKKIFN